MPLAIAADTPEKVTARAMPESGQKGPPPPTQDAVWESIISGDAALMQALLADHGAVIVAQVRSA